MVHSDGYARGPVYAIIAAALFGVSTPLSKLLLGDIDPVLFAALLYLGSGVGLFLAGRIRRTGNGVQKEARLDSADYPWLAGAILAGGVIAPISLLYGLQATPAATASLLLNLEIVTTTLIAYFIFAESVGHRVLVAISVITVAGIVLSWNVSGQPGFPLAASGIILACIFWGIDNNLTRKIAGKDPIAIATVKGFGAGGVSLGIALLTHAHVPGFLVAAAAMGIGFFTFGLSIVFFARSLRDLGAARTSAYFAAAPFIGSIISVVVFRTMPDMQFLIALLLFLAGVLLLVSERHTHSHVHERMVHVHRHRHDEHHMHAPPGEQDTEHAHEHVHEPIDHEHPHTPDIHHRHEK